MRKAIGHGIGIVVCSLIGLASTWLILVAGSHQYGAYSRAWQHVGIKGLIAISVIAYLCATGLLVDIRRAARPKFLPLLFALLVAVTPFVFFVLVVLARILHGGD